MVFEHRPVANSQKVSEVSVGQPVGVLVETHTCRLPSGIFHG